MPREIDRQAAAQKRSSRLLIGMAAFIFLGAAVYGVLLFITSRRTPADPDTRYTPQPGLAAYSESPRSPVGPLTQHPARAPVPRPPPPRARPGKPGDPPPTAALKTTATNIASQTDGILFFPGHRPRNIPFF